MSGWNSSKNGNALRYPVHATIASHWNSLPSANTTLSSKISKLSRCNSASRRTMAVTKPSFLHPNLENADVFCFMFNSPIFCNTRLRSDGGLKRATKRLAIWFTYPIVSPSTYGLEYRARFVFKSVTRPFPWIRGIKWPCNPRMAMAVLAATLLISLVMSDPDSPAPMTRTRFPTNRSGLR